MKSSSFGQKIINAPYILWSVLFVIAPLVMVLYYALTDSTGAFSLSSVSQIKDYAGTFILSIGYGALATLISLVIAYPFAYFLAHTKANFQRMSVMLVMLPMWMSFLIRTYSWMAILQDTGIINTFLGKLGIDPVHMINTGGAVILGMVYNFVPYMILPIYSVMAKLDLSMVEACQDLGGNTFNVLRRCIIPLSIPGVVSGITMVFVPSVSTFYISQKLGGGSFDLIGDVIERQFQQSYNYNLGAALSLVLMVLIVISMAIMNHFSEGGEGEMVI